MIRDTIQKLKMLLPDPDTRPFASLHLAFTHVDEAAIKNAHVTFNATHFICDSRSTCDIMSTDLADYVVRAMQMMEQDIVKKAISVAEEDIRRLHEESLAES